MEKIKEEFYINYKSKEIVSQTIWSRKFIKDLSENEIEDLLSNESLVIFVNSQLNQLTLIPSEDYISFFNNEIKSHVNNSAFEKALSEFKNGYCFFAELWNAKNGIPIIVLKYSH